MSVVTIELPFCTPTLNHMLRNAWRHEKLAWCRSASWLIAAAGRPPATPYPLVELEIIRYSRGKRLDRDNLFGGFKPLIDLLKPMHPTINPWGMGWIADDNDEVIVRLSGLQMKGAPRTIARLTPC